MLIASISTAFYIVATDPGMALCAERRRSRVESFRELSRSLHGRRHELKSSAAEILKVCTQHLGAGGRLPVPYSDFCFSQAMNPSRSSAGMMSYGASPIDLA
jgi:hypothetical protein